MEIFLGDALLSFDGRVIEAFGNGQTASGRVHLATLDHLKLDETRRGAYLQAHTVWGGTPFLVEFPKEQLAQAQAFVAEVDRARSARPN